MSTKNQNQSPPLRLSQSLQHTSHPTPSFFLCMAHGMAHGAHGTHTSYPIRFPLSATRPPRPRTSSQRRRGPWHWLGEVGCFALLIGRSVVVVGRFASSVDIQFAAASRNVKSHWCCLKALSILLAICRPFRRLIDRRQRGLGRF